MRKCHACQKRVEVNHRVEIEGKVVRLCTMCLDRLRRKRVVVT